MSYLGLENLEIYIIARDLSRKSWVIYASFNWQVKKIIGDQFLRSVDSIGANIAEGYSRYYFADKIRFYYNARASLVEAEHWLDILAERKIIDINNHGRLKELFIMLLPKLNSFIKFNQTKK